MKHHHLTATLTAGIVFFFSSCGSGPRQKALENALDSSHALVEQLPVPHKPGNELIIRHKVANFTKWKVVYEAHDSVRRLFGLSNYLLGRGMDDSNIVIVILKMEDVNKARKFTASPEMKTGMQKAGVTDKPTMIYLDRIMHDSTKIDQNARLLVNSKVKDWDAWKKVFDASKQERLTGGLRDRGLGYSFDDNHMATMIFAVTDMQKATAFLKSPGFKEKMALGSVEGPSNFFFYTVVQKY